MTTANKKRVLNLSDDRYKGIGKRIRLKRDLNDVEPLKIYTRDAAGNIIEEPDNLYTTIRLAGKILKRLADANIYNSDLYNIGKTADEYFDENPDAAYMDFDNAASAENIPLNDLHETIDPFYGVLDINSVAGLDRPIFGDEASVYSRRSQLPILLLVDPNQNESHAQRRRKNKELGLQNGNQRKDEDIISEDQINWVNDDARRRGRISSAIRAGLVVMPDPSVPPAVDIIMQSKAPRYIPYRPKPKPVVLPNYDEMSAIPVATNSTIVTNPIISPLRVRRKTYITQGR